MPAVDALLSPPHTTEVERNRIKGGGGGGGGGGGAEPPQFYMYADRRDSLCFQH